MMKDYHSPLQKSRSGMEISLDKFVATMYTKIVATKEVQCDCNQKGHKAN